MNEYVPVFEGLYRSNALRYAGLRERIKKRVDQILVAPYQGTEELGHPPGGMNLRGCRSAWVGRNFRIIFVVCEECRREPNCEFCFCEGRADRTVVFLNIGPHESVCDAVIYRRWKIFAKILVRRQNLRAIFIGKSHIFF